jgi:hypothetical protein
MKAVEPVEYENIDRLIAFCHTRQLTVNHKSEGEMLARLQNGERG